MARHGVGSDLIVISMVALVLVESEIRRNHASACIELQSTALPVNENKSKAATRSEYQSLSKH